MSGRDDRTVPTDAERCAEPDRTVLPTNGFTMLGDPDAVVCEGDVCFVDPAAG